MNTIKITKEYPYVVIHNETEIEIKVRELAHAMKAHYTLTFDEHIDSEGSRWDTIEIEISPPISWGRTALIGEWMRDDFDFSKPFILTTEDELVSRYSIDQFEKMHGIKVEV